MCKLMEDYGEKIRVRSWAEGKAESAKEFALSLWNDGMRDLQHISELTKLSVDEIKKLIEENPV